MITILKRTLMIHARNRAGILFSLLSAFLVFLICVVFMQDSMINNVMQLSPSSSRDQVSWMISCWVMAGLLSITPVTTSCGVLVFMVMDREKKIIKDFKSSPLRKFDYPLGLVLAAVIFSFLIFIICLLFFPRLLFFLRILIFPRKDLYAENSDCKLFALRKVNSSTN